MEVSLDEAAGQLDELIDIVLSQGPVVLAEDGVPRARLLAIEHTYAVDRAEDV